MIDPLIKEKSLALDKILECLQKNGFDVEIESEEHEFKVYVSTPEGDDIRVYCPNHYECAHTTLVLQP